MIEASERAVRWVFLDRDGTINVEPARGEYVTAPDQISLIAGAPEAIRRLNEAKIWVGIATNQRAVALARMSAGDLEAVHERLLAELAATGARVDGVYVCPHEQGTCDCRKPLPGLLLRAQREIAGMDLRRAAMIGDSPSDVQAGRAVGATTVLLAAAGAESAGADHVAASLDQAVDWLLAERS